MVQQRPRAADLWPVSRPKPAHNRGAPLAGCGTRADSACQRGFPAPRYHPPRVAQTALLAVTTGVVVVGVVAAGNGSQRGDRVGPVAGRRGADDLAMGPVTVSWRLVASREMREDCPLGPAADPPRTRSEPSYPAVPFPSDY